MESTKEEVRVLSYNVGHGDCTLVEYENSGEVSFRCLVDGGKSLPEALLNHLKSRRRGKGMPDIDALVLTHVDADHQGGLPTLISEGIHVGEYLGPCLPAFQRLKWLFADRVQKAVDRAGQLEKELLQHQVPVTYPLEGFTKRYACGRVSLSVISPAARLLEKLSTANGGELSNLLMRWPVALQWLLEAAPDEPEDDNQAIRKLFRGRISLSPDDFSQELPEPRNIDSASLQKAALKEQPEFVPEFFGNAVLNDTSLVVVLDIHLEGMHRKRILLTGDQENWSYLAARHAGGLGVDVLKAPHHGGRIYLDDRREAMEQFYLWLRPRIVLVSANGQHHLPRLGFRDALRSAGATLLCPNIRSIEPLTAGFAIYPEAKSCFDAFGKCSPPQDDAVTTVTLTAKEEYADVGACVQGIIHGGAAPIIVLRQDVISPSESIVRYTRGELEKHAQWIQAELIKLHENFKGHAATTDCEFTTRVKQESVPWRSIAAAALTAGRHNLAADPEPVLQFARSHRQFLVHSERYSHIDGLTLYRKPTAAELGDAEKWLLSVPRILLYADLDARQLATNAKLDILQSANWDVVDGLLAGKLAVPLEFIATEIRPGFLQTIGNHFTARICRAEYSTSHKFEAGYSFLLLEQKNIQQPFPDFDENYWSSVRWWHKDFFDAPWKFLMDAASDKLLLGNQFSRKRETRCEFMDRSQPFDEWFSRIQWTPLWED